MKFFFLLSLGISFSQLESCGLIEQRVNIQAQEDVYSMTKTKVTKFQENEDNTKKKSRSKKELTFFLNDRFLFSERKK